jgi:hypothetical protein
MGQWSLVNPRAVVLKMCSADYTPQSVGIDYGGLSLVPYDPNQNQAVIAFSVIDIFLRIETPAVTGTTSVKIQRSTGTGGFINAGYLNTTSVDVGSGAHEPTTRPAAISVSTINSGDKLLPEWTALGSGIQGATLYVVLLEQG